MYKRQVLRGLCELPTSVGLKVPNYTTRAKPRCIGRHGDSCDPIDVTNPYVESLDILRASVDARPFRSVVKTEIL